MIGRAELVGVDDAYDRDYASDRVSRYGVYLRDRGGWFDNDGDPVNDAWHAVLAWRVASGPIMAPGYVRTRSDLAGVTLRGAEDEPGLLVANVEVRLDWARGLSSALGSAWRSWDLELDLGSDQLLLEEPRDQSAPAVLVTASVRVPIRADELPRRRCRQAVDTNDAKRVVRAVCAQINAVAAAAVAALREAR